MVKLQFLASQMVLEGPPRWPGVAIETSTPISAMLIKIAR